MHTKLIIDLKTKAFEKAGDMVYMQYAEKLRIDKLTISPPRPPASIRAAS